MFEVAVGEKISYKSPATKRFNSAPTFPFTLQHGDHQLDNSRQLIFEDTESEVHHLCGWRHALDWRKTHEANQRHLVWSGFHQCFLCRHICLLLTRRPTSMWPLLGHTSWGSWTRFQLFYITLHTYMWHLKLAHWARSPRTMPHCTDAVASEKIHLY